MNSSEPSKALVDVTDATFEAEVIRSPLPVVLDFYADWCVPCRMDAPVVAVLAGTLAGRVKFATVNVDEAAHTARRFGIHSIPTFVFLRSGRECGREVGPLDPVVFRESLRRYFPRRSVPSGGTPANR